MTIVGAFLCFLAWISAVIGGILVTVNHRSAERFGASCIAVSLPLLAIGLWVVAL